MKGALDVKTLFKPFLELIPDNVDMKYKNHFIVDNSSLLKQLSNLIQTKWTWGGIHDYLLIKILIRFDKTSY